MSTDKNTNTNKAKENDSTKLAKEKENESNNVNKLDLFEEDDLFEEFEEGIFLNLYLYLF